jgi:hypothetical protein
VIPDLGRGSVGLIARGKERARIILGYSSHPEIRGSGLAAAAVEGDEEIIGVSEEFFVDVGAGEFHQSVGEF